MTQIAPNTQTNNTQFTREVYRDGYLEYRAKYKHEFPADHEWNEMVMRLKAKFRKIWLAAYEWEKAQ